MFEYEKYVHNVFNKQLLDAYLQRVLLRIDACKVYYDVKVKRKYTKSEFVNQKEK